MKVTRNIFIILYVILLVINDPQIARAHTIEGIGISQAGIRQYLKGKKLGYPDKALEKISGEIGRASCRERV